MSMHSPSPHLPLLNGVVRRQRTQAGFIFGYLLSGIALIALTAYGLSKLNSVSNSKAYLHKTQQTLERQISSIHSVLTTCAMMYPSGDNGSGFHNAYPAGTAATVLGLNCPGSPHSNQNLWTGRNGETPPLMPTGMTVWAYTNNATGIFITTTTNGSTELNKAAVNVTGKYVSSQISFDSSTNTLKYWVLKE